MLRSVLRIPILGAVLLPGQTLQTPDNLRAAFSRIYSAMDSAYSTGRFDEVTAHLMPDATVRTAGEVFQFRNTVAELKRMSPQATVNWRTKIVSVVVNGEEATVTAESEFALAKQHFRGTSRDTWVRQPGGWRLRQREWLTQERVVAPTNANLAKVTADLKRYAVPVTSVEPGSDVRELARIGNAIGDARIVALGEASHGTREFFRMKHRILQYLVAEKGFTVFAIEANWPESLVVDRYIKTGEGDAKAALRGMYFWIWNTQEVLDMIEWMRAFNAAPGDHPVLTFTSFDMQTGIKAAAMALDYIRRISPTHALEAETALKAAAAPAGELLPNQSAARSAAEHVTSVIALFDEHKNAWIERSSANEWRDARQAAEVVRQSALNTVNYGTSYRDQAMARNVEWLAEEAFPGEKIFLWGHNGHLSRQPGSGAAGERLWRRYGPRYHVLGFSFLRGEVRANPGQAVHSVPPVPKGAGSSVLGAAGIPRFYLDLRAVPGSSALGKWLSEPHLFLQIGARMSTGSGESNLQALTLAACFDSLIFIDESSASAALR